MIITQVITILNFILIKTKRGHTLDITSTPAIKVVNIKLNSHITHAI